jgi:hypothetical protein
MAEGTLFSSTMCLKYWTPMVTYTVWLAADLMAQ